MLRRAAPLLCALVAFALAGSPTLANDQQEASTDAKSLWVTSIARIGDSDHFAAATADSLLLREASVYSFLANNPNQLKKLYSHPAAVWCVGSTTDGKHVASVDYRGNLVIYNTESEEAKTHEDAFERWCQAMQVAPDSKSIVAGNEAGKVMVWDLEAAKVSKSIELDAHAVTGLAFSPDGSQLAASDGAGHVHLLKWPELESVGQIQVGEQPAWCVAWTDGEHLLVGSSDRQLYRVPAKADAKPESVAKGSDWITQLAVSPGGNVAAGEVGGRLHFPSSGGSDSMDATSGVWTLCWNGDGQLFAGTRKDGIVMASRSWKWTEPSPPAEQVAEQSSSEEDSEEEKEEESAEPEAEESPSESSDE